VASPPPSALTRKLQIAKLQMLRRNIINDAQNLEDDGSPAEATPPANRHNRSDVAGDIAEMLERQLVVYSSHRLSRLAERMNMPLNDVKALEMIRAFETISTGQLAHMLGVSSGGVTALINRLERAGYIARGRHRLDRRIIVIRPKSEGYPALINTPALAGEHVDQSACQYDLDQLKTVQTFLSDCALLLKEETTKWLASRQHM
jgi:DNA-binding MarR family transcriptional regulator